MIMMIRVNSIVLPTTTKFTTTMNNNRRGKMVDRIRAAQSNHE